MAGVAWPGKDAVLRGLFGTFLNSAEEKQDTATVWAQLREASESWAAPALEIELGREPTSEEIANAGKALLSGISAADVSNMRGIAGQYAGAHQALRDLDTELQIPSEAIFRAPWAESSGSAAVQERYRLRVKWNIEFRGFERTELSEWNSYQLEGPLTTIEDALAQARNAFAAAEYNKRASILGVEDYAIEAI